MHGIANFGANEMIIGIQRPKGHIEECSSKVARLTLKREQYKNREFSALFL